MRKIERFFIPYFSFYIFITILGLNKEFRVKQIAYLIYGGRTVSSEIGVWWFSGCMLSTLFIFTFLCKIIRKQSIFRIVMLMFYLAAFIESFLLYGNMTDIHIPYKIPLSLDVCLLSVPLFYIGYQLKRSDIKQNTIKKEIVVILIIFLCLFELVLFRTNILTYEVDMKYSKISHPLLFILVLSAWGSLLFIISQELEKAKIMKILFQKCGELSYAIMFIHVPLIYFLKGYTANNFLICMFAIILSICIAMAFSANAVTRVLFIDGNLSSLNISKRKS